MILIDEYKKAQLYKLVHQVAWMKVPVRYEIKSKEGQLDHYSIEHRLTEKGISEAEAIKIARNLIDKHIEYRQSNTISTDGVLLDAKITEEPFEQWEADKAFDGNWEECDFDD